MQGIALAVFGWMLAAAATPAGAQAWLTVAGTDGRFRLEMPVPFDLPPSRTEPDGTVTLSYEYETAEVALRFEVVDAAASQPEQVSVRPVLVSRSIDGARILQTRTYVVGHRTYRAVASSTPELEGDALIHRFLESVRLQH